MLGVPKWPRIRRMGGNAMFKFAGTLEPETVT